jgi:hypothetical protein
MTFLLSPLGKYLAGAALVLSLLGGCGGPLDLITGGGPNVAANVQAGAENTQGVRSSQDSAQDADAGRDVRQTQERDARVRTERIETQTVIQNERVPAWIWLLVVAGWLLDSPTRWLSDWRERRKS